MKLPSPLPSGDGGTAVWAATTAAEFRAVRPRALRLSIVSAGALGLITWLAVADGSIGRTAVSLLFASWLLMAPSLSLARSRPRLRHLTAPPSGLAFLGAALAAMDSGWEPAWLLVTAGSGLGGLMGAWLWLGWAPAPPLRTQPGHPVRLGLIACHVALVAAGLCWLLAS